MRKKAFHTFTALFWVLIALTLQGQNTASSASVSSLNNSTQIHLADFLRTDPEHLLVRGSDIQQEFEGFIQNLRHKQPKYKSEKAFLEYVYYKVHHKYLKHYRTPVAMKELFESKQYDCLTGTAVYAMIFEALGLETQIKETTHHIYLMIHVNGNPILVESTSPLYGFVTNPGKIQALIASYSNDNTGSTNTNFYKFQKVINETVSLNQLAGLHFYNMALDAYNQQDLTSAILQMEQAINRYPGERMSEVMRRMLLTLDAELNIDGAFKRHYLNKYAHLQDHSTAEARR